MRWGATKWEMVRMAVLPFGVSGVIGAVILGLGAGRLAKLSRWRW